MDVLIGALVVATFGFGGIITSSASVARAIVIGLFLGIVLLLLPGLLRARIGARKRRFWQARKTSSRTSARGSRHGADYQGGLVGGAAWLRETKA